VTTTEVDCQEIIQEAMVIIENTLTWQGFGVDPNLSTALHILRDSPWEVVAPESELQWDIARIWNRELRPRITEHAQPMGLTRGTLFVHVDTQLHLSEIVRLRRKRILSRLQQFLGREVVQRISFRLGRLPNEFEVVFWLPQDVFEVSTHPVTPCYFNDDEPWSARRCVREALEMAGESKRVTASFGRIVHNESESDSEVGDFAKLVSFWEQQIVGYYLTDKGKQTLRELMSRYTNEEIKQAMQKSANQYRVFNNLGRVSEESVNTMWDKVGAICYVQRLELTRPYMRKLYRIRKILERRFADIDEREALHVMMQAADLNLDLEDLERHTKEAVNYRYWLGAIEEFVNEQMQEADR
jgi:macrodomain Ter protein organizer (MatP/YcbG family)